LQKENKTKRSVRQLANEESRNKSPSKPSVVKRVEEFLKTSAWLKKKGRNIEETLKRSSSL